MNNLSGEMIIFNSDLYWTIINGEVLSRNGEKEA